MEVRELICIGCPLGCPLTVKMDGDQIEEAAIPVKEATITPEKRN